MARIDSILGIVRHQGADELRVGVNREPSMFARGAPKRLSIPATSEETLRVLLGELLSPECEQRLRERGTYETSYEAGPLGSYRVTFTPAPSGFDVVFVTTPAPAPAATVDAGPVAQTRTPPRPAAAPQPRAATAEAPAADLQPCAAVVSPHAYTPVAELLARAVALRASDLHLASGEPAMVRVDGALQLLDVEPIADLVQTLGLDASLTARAFAGEGLDHALELPGTGRVRVHVYRTASGLAAALRLLPRAAPSFAALHMPVPFDDLIDLPHGLVLVCGAAGSGKSTTLAALAQEALRRRSCVLVTLEDPIEYALAPGPTSLVRRRQVGRDVRDFASGLRDALRADPEVLLLGELRDPETIALALTAAETGHLVLASLHSRSSASAVERIVDAFAPEQQQQVRLQLAEALRAVIAQRLLPRAHGEGRVPAIELLRCTRAVSALIREGKTAQFASVLQSGRREGMLALERSLADRVLAGEISSTEAYAATNDAESLTIFLTRSA